MMRAADLSWQIAMIIFQICSFVYAMTESEIESGQSNITKRLGKTNQIQKRIYSTNVILIKACRVFNQTGEVSSLDIWRQSYILCGNLMKYEYNVLAKEILRI